MGKCKLREGSLGWRGACTGDTEAQATTRSRRNQQWSTLLHSARCLETVALLHLGSLFAHMVIVSLVGGTASSALRHSEARHTRTRIAVGVQRYRFPNEQRTANSGQRQVIQPYRITGMECQILAFR